MILDRLIDPAQSLRSRRDGRRWRPRALGISSGGEAIWRTKEMTGAIAMRIFSRGVIVGLFIGLYIGWAF
jgi:hypothetical protein